MKEKGQEIRSLFLDHEPGHTRNFQRLIGTLIKPFPRHETEGPRIIVINIVEITDESFVAHARSPRFPARISKISKK